MTRQPPVARTPRTARVSVVATAPVAGGDTSTATKLRLSDGTTAIMKTHPHAPDGFFAAEAHGLRWLAEAGADGGVAVPEVLARRRGVPDPALGRARQDHRRRRRRLRRVARRHPRRRRRGVRRESTTASSAGCRCRTRRATTWAEFYAVRRVLPYLKLARDRDAVSDDEAAAVESLIGQLTGADARRTARPPARRPVERQRALGPRRPGLGHRPRGVRRPPRGRPGHARAFRDAPPAPGSRRLPGGTPLAEGWEERAAVHQLFPLLVHAALSAAATAPAPPTPPRATPDVTETG